ncbi:MAG: 6-carboxytetrahydropterin synthase QueD [bacterium]
MFEISAHTHFSAAHRLVGYPGACARFHGHNWDVEVFLRGAELDELGILCDFRTIKSALNAALEEFDHADLNSVAAFAVRNPTSEALAHYIYDKLSLQLNTTRCRVQRVAVSETPGTAASYWADDDSAAQR